MAGYIPPNKTSIPFVFSTGGYQAPDFDSINMGLRSGAGVSDLRAAINVMQTYQHTTFSFLKYCETYIVGYSAHGVQVIKGKCHYGGIRDLGGDIGGHYPGDLPAWIGGVVTADLSAEIIGDLSTQQRDLPALIGGHYPTDLGGAIAIHDPENLLAYIRGFDIRDLGAIISGLTQQDLPANIYGIPPEDLTAYIKAWPQEDLPASLHGWDTLDLTAYLNTIARDDLPASIGAHRPKDIHGLIKGWVREATSDLGGTLQSYHINDLGAYIRTTEMAQLPAYVFPIQPQDLPAYIRGWQAMDLQGIIQGDDYPWNLPASLGGHLPGNLPASINITGWTLPNLKNLPAYILATRGVDNLPASIGVRQARDLTAFIDTGRDIKDLPAEIYPKRLRLTGILSVITMEHADLSATISVPCFYSNLKDLSAYIHPVFKSDLGALIYPKGYVYESSNLSASFGYSPTTQVQDKLIINISVASRGYRTEDKYTISISVFRSGLNLGASITPVDVIYMSNLSAYVNGVDVKPYDFTSWKGKERVFDRTYSQVVRDYEDVDISFQTIVKDYFYSSGSDVVAKVDKYTHFVTKVASYYSPATSRRLDRRLHKVKYLYDMRHFDDIDEAMRYAIWYVTTYPEADLGASINGII